MIAIALLIIAALIVLYVIYTYNRFIRLKNLTLEGWSGIDVQLKQRADLIPNLLEIVKDYLGHEHIVLEKVTESHAQALASNPIQERAHNENRVTNALKELFAVSENYPDLKASQNFIELQNALISIENQIQTARRYYNGTVRDFNTCIESFPNNIVAKSFQFKPVDFFEGEVGSGGNFR